MESMPRSQPLHCLTFVFVQFCVICARNFDSLMQRVAFYPAPLIISHSPKPLTFYAETELLNVHTVLNFTDLSGSFAMSNKSCSVPLEKFLINYCLLFAVFKKLFVGFFLCQAFQLWLSVTLIYRGIISLW